MEIEEIINMLSNGELTPTSVRNLLLSIRGKFVIPSIIFEKETLIFRASLISEIKEAENYRRLSYKPAELNTHYQRACIPYSTMFYGIISNSYISALGGCLGEICECLRNENAVPKKYLVAISIWELLNDMTLPAMIDPYGRYNKSKAFSIQDDLNEIITKNNLTNKSNNLAFLDFMNKEFKKRNTKESDYWISAIYTDIITKIMDYDGVVYESVQSVDPQLSEVKCIALTPDFVDKNLICSKAIIYEFDFITKDIGIHPKKIHEISYL